MVDERAVLPPRLAASWQRSRQYGVSPETVRPAFTGTVDHDSLFFECGQEVLRGLHTTLANEPISLMLTDSDGLVLSRLCDDTGITRSLDRVHLAPGFSYAERDAGTNGLGLALADRAPSLVSAEEHYCTGLWGYTCAAAPVVEPGTNRLVGSVNLTTWSKSSKELLLALAQSAAGNTAALMLARSHGHPTTPVPRGEVYHVYAERLPDVSAGLSRGWADALAEAREAMERGRVVCVTGEPGSGKAVLASTARRALRPRERILNARPPAPADAESWLALWTPEVGKDDTCVIVSGTDALPAYAAEQLAQLFTSARGSFVLTAADHAGIPEALRTLIDTVVEVPALRYRPDDVLPLAGHFAHESRGRAVTFTPAASRALTAYPWPGNVRQLRQVVREAVWRADVVDTRHLPGEVFTSPGRRLTRMEAVERDEIVRCLTRPGTTAAQVASMLGMSRATVYRKIAQYGIKVPRR
ncbi:AAA-type ATPase lid domain-containing protein [Amycolatopsis thermophila]|uniref:Transcriptional regulator of acetoin/glycerol metabolism n=1 Tax=Amycolatopsis thermophila TaxID=206084 RepID=A0ABU0F088_9PSEU|nr:GAF domain-containing protein [Amycolatopsis thermophila]MDQ0380908.1 transcriptional regulator of acetoin/glycerol metabolism [Amycolatopsis thermophila]